jgi:hypothetical protein
LWAVALARLIGRLKTHGARWTAWILLGALLPSLVAWFIVMPLKGAPLAGGGSAEVVLTALLLNGAWGFGVALLLRAADLSAEEVRGRRHFTGNASETMALCTALIVVA